MTTQAVKRIALYARVSTSKCEKCGKRQSDHDALDHEYRGQDAEVQLRELREYVECRGWQLTEIYTDSVSGTKNSRPGLDKLMGDAARRRFDVVVVWRFDRFARSVSHLLRALEQFQALGDRFRVPFGECGYEYSHWEDDFHCLGCRGRAGTQPDRRTSQGRLAKCPREGKETRTPKGRCEGLPD
jgi:DNA invertase Pin-like site-specific DNA recombinase